MHEIKFFFLEHIGARLPDCDEDLARIELVTKPHHLSISALSTEELSQH